MKIAKILLLPLIALVTIVVISAFGNSTSSNKEPKDDLVEENELAQTINLFVTHGHCSTPFGGIVENLEIETSKRVDQGNPLENMKISFEIDPETFNVCASQDLTDRIKTPGLFIGEKDEKITFRSTDVYTMGLDWYQVNGKMGIKGVEKSVKFFVSGIRYPKESMTSSLVLEGQLNLADWGIDYDLIVNGESSEVPTKWMHLNMKMNL